MIDKSKTEIFRIGLISGYCKMCQVVEWADNMILAGYCDYDYIQISTAANINDLITRLNAIEGRINRESVVHGFFSELNDYLSMNPNASRKVIKTLYWFMMEIDHVLTKEEKADIYTLEDDYELAEMGIYGSIQTVEEELRLFLHRYSNEKKKDI